MNNLENNIFFYFQIPSPNEKDVPSGFQVLATKTYFTTSTYYTTLIDKSRTVTRTRTKVKVCRVQNFPYIQFSSSISFYRLSHLLLLPLVL